MSGASVLDPGTASWILFGVFFSLMFLRVPGSRTFAPLMPASSR